MNSSSSALPRKRVETILFLENKLVDKRHLARMAEMPLSSLEMSIEEINQRYEQIDSPYRIREVEEAYQLSLTEDFQDRILEHYIAKKKKLSKSFLETLGIIAYRQPITRAEVEDIRGVNCAPYLRHLSDEGFIQIVGKKDTVGNPYLYSTTTKFLIHFGLKSLKEMPSIEEIKNYDFLSENDEETGLSEEKLLSRSSEGVEKN